MSSKKQVSDEEREKLKKMLHGNYYGYGSYEGRGILFQKLTDLMCPNCGNNRMHKVWLVRKSEEETSKRVMITYMSITFGIVVCIVLSLYVIDKTGGRVLSYLSFLESRAIVYGIPMVILPLILILARRKERKNRLRII